MGRDSYAQAILTGGFPVARLRSEALRRTFFESYATTIVERDVADTSRVRDPASVGVLLRLLAARSGSLARYESLARDVGVDGKTIKAHVEVLERLFLVRIRPSWHVNLGQRQVKTPKIYMVDSGLQAGLMGADVGRVRDDGGLAGALFETFAAVELERQASWSTQPLTFWHYREGRREVDVIVERPSGEIVAVEVKAGATVRAGDFAGLVHLRERIGPRLRAGVVLYTGERTLPFGPGLWALPLSGLWETDGL